MTNTETKCECPVCALVDTNTNICGFMVETTDKSVRPITPVKELTKEQEAELLALVVECEERDNLRKRGDTSGDEDTYFHYTIECLMRSGKRRIYKVCFHSHQDDADDPAKTD